jgi:hypothetical protein
MEYFKVFCVFFYCVLYRHIIESKDASSGIKPPKMVS